MVENKKLRILQGQTVGEKIKQILLGKGTRTWEKIKNSMVKFKGTRHFLGLTVGSVWKWKGEAQCFSQDRVTFNDCDMAKTTD